MNLHFLTTCIWDALSGNAKQMKPSLNSTQKCSNHVFLLEQERNYRDGKKPHAHAEACRRTTDMLKNALKNCELTNKKEEQHYKVSHPCLDDHQFTKEELESVGEWSEVCSQIVLKCLYLARIGRPAILWSVNKWARSVTKRTQACDK